MPHPPGALKTTEEVRQTFTRQGCVYGVIVPMGIVPMGLEYIIKFTAPLFRANWWNLDGKQVHDADKYDFLFANYFHAFAYACKIKAQLNAGKKVKA